MANVDQHTPHCSGNCMKCTHYQRVYCSSQIAYNNMKMLEELTQQVVNLQASVKVLEENLEDQDEGFINPIETAQ